MPEQTTNTQTDQPKQTEPQEPINFDDFLGGQDERVKAAYEAHVSGLKNTVKATREERDSLAAQLREVAKKAEKGSELETQLNETLTRLEATEKRLSFLDEASKPEIGCRNPKAAFALAQAGNLYDRQGRPDWTAIRAEAPELFGVKVADANAGSGTGTGMPPKQSMDALIRRAAGRGQ